MGPKSHIGIGWEAWSQRRGKCVCCGRRPGGSLVAEKEKVSGVDEHTRTRTHTNGEKTQRGGKTFQNERSVHPFQPGGSSKGQALSSRNHAYTFTHCCAWLVQDIVFLRGLVLHNQGVSWHFMPM